MRTSRPFRTPTPRRSAEKNLGPKQMDLHQFDLHPTAAAKIAVRVHKDDRVLEIGAGTGSLTQAILARGAVVTALEVDPDRIAALSQRFPKEIASNHLKIIRGDALTLRPKLGGPWRVVANPPFKHTSQLLRAWLLEDHPDGPPQALDLLLQEQAVWKIAGRKGSETVTSVLAHLWGRVEQGENLDRRAVTPPSHVPLRIVQLTRHAQAPSPAQMRAIARILDIAFAGAHQIGNALKTAIPPSRIQRLAQSVGFDPTAHPRTLSPEQWLKIVMG